MKTFRIIFTLLIAGITASCTIRAPELRVTGEKTALEKEVIGTYDRIRQDTWMIASTRGAGQRQGVVSPEKRRVLEAIQRQKFNKDDIEEFKKKGWVGENIHGFLDIRENTKSLDDETLKLVTEIVSEENEDRETIVVRIIEINGSLNESAKKNIEQVFARMYQENSPRGTWIQNIDGSWHKK
ncbi:hypothetical protein DRQ07_04635 [candidate division KSB1 bacterium]|nr:MAG: hypothetical protein DRQ07_04635 [candidate division KSB1 bacterium]